MSFYLNQIPSSTLERSCVKDHVGHSADTLSVTKCCEYEERVDVIDKVPGSQFECLVLGPCTDNIMQSQQVGVLWSNKRGFKLFFWI